MSVIQLYYLYSLLEFKVMAMAWCCFSEKVDLTMKKPNTLVHGKRSQIDYYVFSKSKFNVLGIKTKCEVHIMLVQPYDADLVWNVDLFSYMKHFCYPRLSQKGSPYSAEWTTRLSEIFFFGSEYQRFKTEINQLRCTSWIPDFRCTVDWYDFKPIEFRKETKK